jgi:hypothetical protein
MARIVKKEFQQKTMNQAGATSTTDHSSPSACLNCGADLSGIYCAACGQRVETHPPTIGHFLEEIIETLTHADSRLWLTVRLLIAKPGHLSREFFAGRRAGYMPPIRLYFVLSILFFLLLAIGPEKTAKPIEADQNDLSTAVERCRDLKYNGPYVSTIEPKLQAACTRTVQDLQQGGTRLTQTFLQNLPKAMFVLLPLFAAFMLAFYWRPRRLYAEHLIFLVHNHSAAFLSLTIITLLDYIIPKGLEGWLAPTFFIWLVWYGYRGLRVFYAQSRLLTLAKMVGLTLLYLTISVLVISFTGLAAALSI